MSAVTFRVDFPRSFAEGVSCPLPPVVTLEVDLSPEHRNLISSRLNEEGDRDDP